MAVALAPATTTVGVAAFRVFPPSGGGQDAGSPGAAPPAGCETPRLRVPACGHGADGQPRRAFQEVPETRHLVVELAALR